MSGPTGLPRETGGAVPLGVLPWDEVRDGPEPEEPSDAELLGVWPDPFAGSPDGADAWLADLSVPELDALARRWACENGRDIPGAIGADFTQPAEADGLAAVRGGGASGFEVGGVLDTMKPGPNLAGLVAGASAAGLSLLSDNELTGLLRAVRRLLSWQAAVEFRIVAELDHRRHRGSDNMSSASS